MTAKPKATPLRAPQLLGWARQVIEAEAEAVRQLMLRLDERFVAAVEMLCDARQVVVCGMGKAGLIGQKIAATLASTGTPAQFLHPSEALHGDLGRVARSDVVLTLSNSGETEEIVRLLPSLRDLGASIVAITGKRQSTLGRYADAVIELGEITEACPLGLAPSASTAAMLAAGDALALVVSRQKGFAAADFARYHPGGSLGRKLARVEEVMRPLAECRLARDGDPVREVIVSQNRPGRRTGAIMLTDTEGRLSGVFTDSDLARRVADGPSLPLDEPVRNVMTPRPKSVPEGSRLAAALEILATHKISELPVVDQQGRPRGLIDVTDVVELLPSSDEPATPRIYREPDDSITDDSITDDSNAEGRNSEGSEPNAGPSA